LVRVDRVLQLFREQQGHGHGDRVRDDRDYYALRDHARQQIHRRWFEVRQASFDLAYLRKIIRHDISIVVVAFANRKSRSTVSMSLVVQWLLVVPAPCESIRTTDKPSGRGNKNPI